MRKRAILMSAALSLGAVIGHGADTTVSINLNTYDDSKVFTVAAGDTCNLSFSGATTTKKFSKEGNGNIKMSGQSFSLSQWYWKGAGTLTADNCTINVSGAFKSYGGWNEQTNIFSNCTLTADTFANDCERNRLHYGYTFFNGGTYTFNKLYVTQSDSGLGSVVTVRGGASVTVNTELFCVRLTDGNPSVARLVIEDGALSTPQINLGWANATQKQGAVELLGGTLTTKTIVNGPGNADYILGNGGTFAPTTANQDILPSGIEHAYIGANGLTIDSDVNVTISKSFEPWTPESGVSETGPLYKTGTGTLTLTGDASAYEKTVIQGGSVAFGAGVATHPAVEVAEGGLLDYTGCTTKLAGLVLTGGTLKLGTADTIELTAADSFDPQTVTFDLPDISTIHTTYRMVTVPGQVSAAHAAAWAAMKLPEVPEIVHTFMTVYDEATDTTTYALTVEADPNVKRQITVTAGEGGSVDFESGEYLVDTELTITATPNEGYAFTGWAGDAAAGHQYDNPYAFVVGGQDLALTATFALTQQEIDIDLSGGDVTVVVGRGCTATVDSFTGNSAATLSIVGGGTFTMPATVDASSFAALVIDGVTVDVSAIGQLGAGPVTIRNDGGLHVTDSIKLALPVVVTVEDAAHFDVDEGVTLTVSNPRLACTDKQIMKTGLGTLAVVLEGTANFGQTGYWIIAEGDLTAARSSNTSSGFVWNETSTPVVGPTLEIRTGATASGVGAFPKVVLAGGSISSGKCGFPTTSGAIYDHATSFANNGATTIIFNGGIEVLPSATPSRITGDLACFSATNDRKMEINVHEGATLDVDVEFVARRTSNTAVDNVTVRKTGTGTVRFNRPISATGVCWIEDGTVEITKPAAVPCGGFAFRPAGGDLRLADGVTMKVPGGDALLASAEVWFDASRLTGTDGGNLSSIPNFGTCGGQAWNYGLDTTVAKYHASGIGGLPCIYADGMGGALLRTYVNDGTAMTVFCVARNTSWENVAKKGLGGTPVQICSATVGDPNVFNYNFSAANAYQVKFGNTSQTFTSQGVVPTSTDPFLNEAVWNGTAISFRQWWSDDAEAVEWAGTATKAFVPGQFQWVALGSRCYSGGMDAGRRANGMVGEIGEVLIFNRVLTADETAYVRSYLQRKWFASTAASVGLPEMTVRSAAVLGVSVAEGDSAALEMSGGTLNVVKKGDGELLLKGSVDAQSSVSVEAGTLGFKTNSWQTLAEVWLDASDAESVAMDGDLVDSVVNKGSAGGRFTQLVNYTGTESRPSLGTINGRMALLVAGAQGLRLDNFVLDSSRVDQPLYVYLAAERSSFGTSAPGPFMFTSKESDTLTPDGSFFYREQVVNNVNRKTIYCGEKSSAGFSGIAENNVPFVDVIGTIPTATVYDEMTSANTPETAVRNATSTASQPSNHFNCVVIGGLMQNGKLVGETKFGTQNFDRGWFGKIGEFIVFTSPLNATDEKELLDYLHAKWLASETAADPDVPRVLGGGETVFAGGDLAINQKAGSTVVQNGPVVNLGAYTAENGSCWVRETSFDLSEPLFAVDGDVDIDGALTVDFAKRATVNQPLLTYSGTCSVNTLLWTGNNAGSPAKTSHDSAQKQILVPRSGFMLIIR